MYCYCLFCLTAKQNDMEKLISRVYPCMVVNTKITQKLWKRGTAKYVKHLLLPGYLFLYSEERLDLSEVSRFTGVIRVLKNEDMSYELRDRNEEFARWIYRNGGEIAVSKAVREGDRIRVVQGPMADFTGTLLRVNKSRQRAEIAFEFDGIERRMWLSFDWIDAQGVGVRAGDEVFVSEEG